MPLWALPRSPNLVRFFREASVEIHDRVPNASLAASGIYFAGFCAEVNTAELQVVVHAGLRQ